MSDWLKILIPSIAGLITTVAAAFFSACWAVHRAFQERWWERKEKTYSEIVEALHDMIRCSDFLQKSISLAKKSTRKRKNFDRALLGSLLENSKSYRYRIKELLLYPKKQQSSLKS